MKKKVILSSIVTIALCLSLIAGSTYALFTSKQEIGVEVTAGKVKIEAELGDKVITTTSLSDYRDETNGLFELGGTAKVETDEDGNKMLVLDKMVPGDAATVTIGLANSSNVATKYKVRVYIEDGENSSLSDVLVSTASFTYTGEDGTATVMDDVVLDNTATDNAVESAWSKLVPAAAEGTTNNGTITVTVSFTNDSESDQNMYQENTAKVYFQIIAVQANGTSEYDRVNGAESESETDVNNENDNDFNITIGN